MNKIHRIVIGAAVLLAATGGLSGWYLLRDTGAGAGPLSQMSAPIYASGPFRLSVAISPDPPVLGKNRLTIRLQDADAKPVSDAQIDAAATMPAMGNMAAMRAPADLRETAPGHYAGELELPMSGSWPLTVKIDKPGLGRTELGFDLATGRPGLRLATGGHRLGGSEPTPAGGTQPNTPVISLDNRRRQLIGLETDHVERRPLTRTIRAVGEVVVDETQVTDVTLKYDGWVGDLKADYVGAPVKRGQTLFGIYSPALFSAQQEYLEARQRLARRGSNDSLIQAARQRLMLWDIAAAQVRALERRGSPIKYLPIHAPATGTVVEKNVVEGSAVKSGQFLMRIADLSAVWIDAEVYDSELPLVHAGMTAEVTLAYLPRARYEAKVDYVYPYLQGQTRTGRIRLSLPNPDGHLKPDMYAEVKLKADLGERLVVPESAVLFSGETRVVFVDLGDGRLQARYIQTGQRNKDYIEVTSGLTAGERVVTSGNFLLDAETRLKTGIKQW
ncbi:efflux RND transporter periplasmic adaptor subunit [Nitrococcus mobilis]|uniref:Secretion protein HlyD n=1 Tax=Nitrococcus mobilis Nb-231 TaxID=314278 RepID=A4BMB2_9GAMM|nr:efflux RND transporter periplasmic adaptor subunit [Nitrococcus mobilis]EAR23450.1 Secretion protein HlyD [Nitrococcus mobilis Nb-231]